MKGSCRCTWPSLNTSCHALSVKGSCSAVRPGELVSWSRGKSVGVEPPSVRNQITDIERQLKAVEKNRETLREKRLESPVFKIGLIGYTNAGKSTIMNQLTSKSQYEADELFATLDATNQKHPSNRQSTSDLDRYGWFYPRSTNRVGIKL